jgi:hypothetical protein
VRPLAVVLFFTLAVTPVLLLGVDGPWLGRGTPSLRGRHDLPAQFRSDFFTAFDSWFADRIGLRLVFIQIGTGFHVGLLQRPTARQVVFGRDGWMFWPDDGDKVPVTMADVRGHLRLEPREIRQIGEHLRAIRGRLAAYRARGRGAEQAEHLPRVLARRSRGRGVDAPRRSPRAAGSRRIGEW